MKPRPEAAGEAELCQQSFEHLGFQVEVHLNKTAEQCDDILQEGEITLVIIYYIFKNSSKVGRL